MFGHTGGREKLAAGFPGVVCVHSHKVFAGIAESVNVAILHIIQGHLRHTPFNSLTSFSLRSANFPPRPAVYLQLPTLLGGTPRPPILFMSAMTIPPSVQLRHIEY